MGMLTGGHRLILCPGQELVRRDLSDPFLASLFVDHLDLLCELSRMGQEERQVKGSRLIQDAAGRFQIAALLAIGSPLSAIREIKL